MLLPKVNIIIARIINKIKDWLLYFSTSKYIFRAITKLLKKEIPVKKIISSKNKPLFVNTEIIVVDFINKSINPLVAVATRGWNPKLSMIITKNNPPIAIIK